MTLDITAEPATANAHFFAFDPDFLTTFLIELPTASTSEITFSETLFAGKGSTQ